MLYSIDMCEVRILKSYVIFTHSAYIGIITTLRSIGVFNFSENNGIISLNAW